MARALRWLFGMGLGLAVLLVALAAWVLQPAPQVGRRPDVSLADVARARELLRRHDPRRLAPGVPHTLQLSAHDADRLLAHAAARWRGTATRLTLQPATARVQASLPVELGPWRRWLNVDLVLREGAAWPQPERLRLGPLPLPAALAPPLWRFGLLHFGVEAPWRLVRETVQQVTWTPGQVTLRYTWADGTAERARAVLVPEAERPRLQAHAQRLGAWRGGSPQPLPSALAALFALARERSANGGDAAAENRAALLVLAAHASGRGLATLAPALRDGPRPPVFTLHGREDRAQHFLVSAALAAAGNGPLADSVGLYKELLDLRGGSGFSFPDLAADRAGTRFGLHALRAPQAVQAALAAGVDEAALLPDLAGLEDFADPAAFRRRHGALDSPSYRRVLDDIEARLDASPLLPR